MNPAAAPATPAPAQLSRVAPGRRPSLAAAVALWDARLRVRFGARVAKLAAFAVTLIAAVELPFVARARHHNLDISVVVGALGWLSWLVAGCCALSASGPAGGDDERATTALAVSRGVAAAHMPFLRLLAVARRIARLTGFPALVLSLLALAFARTFSALAVRAVFVGTSLAYVLVLSSLLAALVGAARALSPERPRSLFIAFVVLPELLRAVFPSLPSVPSLLGFFLHHVVVWGGAA